MHVYVLCPKATVSNRTVRQRTVSNRTVRKRTVSNRTVRNLMCLISRCAIATCPIVLCASEGLSYPTADETRGIRANPLEAPTTRAAAAPTYQAAQGNPDHLGHQGPSLHLASGGVRTANLAVATATVSIAICRRHRQA